MEKRSLGDSTLEVTPVGFGAWAIGGAMWGGSDDTKAIHAIQASIDAGVNLIDTAPGYGFGKSEELVGRAIGGRRDKVIVATKCGLRWDRTDGPFRFELLAPDGKRWPIHGNLRPDSIRQECEASLRRLGVDSIDLYQIHWPDPSTRLEDSFGELLRLQREGKVRYLGVSNFSVVELERAQQLAAIVSDQPQYNLLDRAIEEEILPWCRRRRVGVIAYSPMGRGILTGKVDLSRRFPPTDHRAGLKWFEPACRSRVLDALEKVRPIAEAHRISLANLAVLWVIGEPGVTAAIVGARDADQATENAKALGVRLSDGERAEIRRAFEGL